MSTPDILEHNRVILCHFDSYSCALNFARYGDSVLAPAPLPESASDMPAPRDAGEQHAPDAVLEALVAKYTLNPAQLNIDEDFEAWISGESGPIRVHLVRISSPDIPHEAIEPMGAVFKPISQMRGMPPLELNLMRQVFNLIIGG
jgi:hypothetical protein